MGKGKQRHKARDPKEEMSRSMSWLLRHGALEKGIKMDSSGFIEMDDLLKYLRAQGFKEANLETVTKVVDTNDKKRFEIKQEKHNNYIRATQGHSIQLVKTEDLLEPIEDPYKYPVVIHGTYMKFWDSIKKEGLKRMTRNHIHFAPGMPKDKEVISGMRGSCDIIVELDLFTAMKDGIKFYISGNNVILTEGIDGVVPPKYFKRVVSKKGDVILEAKEVELEKKQKKQELFENKQKKQE